jgi:hypothetical protein
VIGVETPEQLITVELFPNPNNGILFVEIHGNVEYGEILITDALGKRLFTNSLLPVSIQTVDLSNLAKGFYIVQVIVNEKLFTNRVLLE